MNLLFFTAPTPPARSVIAGKLSLSPEEKIEGTSLLATALDISMGHLVHHHVGAGATLEMKIQYLAPVRSGRVECQATFLKQGRRIFFLQSMATDEAGQSIALGTSTWTLI